MPAVKAKNRSKKAVQTAVAKNMQGLVAANKRRPADKKKPFKQLVAIAFSESKKKK